MPCKRISYTLTTGKGKETLGDNAFLAPSESYLWLCTDFITFSVFTFPVHLSFLEGEDCD